MIDPASPPPARRPFCLRARARGFCHAFRGLARLLATQHNAWIHAAATVAVIAAGFAVHLSRAEWCWIILAGSLVWIVEALNSALEFLADAASPGFHPLIRDAKDIAAAAVLISAIAATAIGILIFGPHVF